MIRVALFGLIQVLIFMLEMDRAAWKMITYALKINMRSSTWLTFPLFWPQLTVFIGFIMLTLMLVVDIARAAGKIRAGVRVEE